MTEFELVESIGIYVSTALEAISIYLTIVSAYLIAAFMAGDRLTKSQVVIVSTLFVAGSLLFTYSSVGLLIRQAHFASKLALLESGTPLPGTAPIAVIIGTIQFGGIIACLKFMWDVRHPKPE